MISLITVIAVSSGPAATIGTRRCTSRWLGPCLAAALLAATSTAHAAPEASPPPASPPSDFEPLPTDVPAAATTESVRSTARDRWFSCNRAASPCVRSRPARALLLGLGVLGGATASALLFGMGDRLAQNDPAVLLAGIGALAGTGAIAGAIAGRLGADQAALPDRLRPSTVGLGYDYTGPQVLDESRPHSMAMRFAPTVFFAGGQSRLRLFGHVGGWLNPRREVDPRPQVADTRPGFEGTAPSVHRQRRLSLGLGFDLAVALPYPATRRSAFLGASELRYRPQVQIRRDTTDPGQPGARIVERTMLLPLSVGARWHLSPRQRFTVYFGPRFDFVSLSLPGSPSLQRGSAMIGPLYAEAWYDIDIGHRVRRESSRVQTTSMLSLGYIHSRFDGQGFDFGPVVGFFGPVHIGWSTRLRPRGAPVAVQLGAFGRLGQGTTMGLELGLVAPDPVLGRAGR